MKKLFISYLYSSPSSPYFPVNSIFVRDEYKSDSENLFHIHLMLEILMDFLNESQKKKIENLIRASIADIVSLDEASNFIKEVILKSWEEVYEIR